MTLGAAAVYAFGLMKDYVGRIGLEEAMRQYDATVFSPAVTVDADGNVASPVLLEDPECVEAFGRKSVDWARQTNAMSGTRVTVEGRENIPPAGTHAIYVLNHVSLLDDFKWNLWDRCIRYVACAKNFHDGEEGDDSLFSVRRLGVKWLAEIVAHPTISRELRTDAEHRNLILMDRMVEMARKYKIRSAWFGTGTRSPTNWEDNGTQGTSIDYAAAPNKKDYWEYIKFGGAVTNAIKLMKATGEKVHLVMGRSNGIEFVNPNLSKSFPWINPNRIDRNIVYKFSKPIIVAPTAEENFNEKIAMSQYGRKLKKSFLDETKDMRGYLLRRLGAWGNQKGLPDIAAFVSERAEKDPNQTLFVVLGRLCALHPSLPERQAYIDRLIAYLQSGQPFARDQEKYTQLMQEITQSVFETQYRHYPQVA